MSESSMPQLNPEYFVSQIFWLTVTFTILYVVMAKFALPKIANIIETRKDIITRDIEDAENYRKESAEMEQDYYKSLKDAQERANLSLSNAKNKLNESLEKEKDDFDRDNEVIIENFEKNLYDKKLLILSKIDDVAHDISQEMIHKLIGRDSLTDDNVRTNIKKIIEER